MVGITALWQKGAPLGPGQPSTGPGRDVRAEPALGQGVRGAGRPLLAAARRSPRRSRGCWGPAPARPAAPGTWRWCGVGKSRDGGGVRVPGQRAGSLPSRALPRALLTWGLVGSFPAGTALERPSAARLLPQAEPAQEPALLAEQSWSPQQLGGRERPAAAAGRRLGAASRALGAAIWSLGCGRGCGCQGRGRATGPGAREGLGSQRRGSGGLGV